MKTAEEIASMFFVDTGVKKSTNWKRLCAVVAIHEAAVRATVVEEVIAAVRVGELSLENWDEAYLRTVIGDARSLAAPPAGPREPFAWCQGGDCGWRGTVSSLVPKINCRICPLCSSTAIIEVGTPEGLSFEEYDRMDGAAAPPAGVGAEATALKPATWAAVQIGRCPNCDEFPAEWSSVGKPCSECGIELTADSDIAEDGTELWTFDFADQADYDRKHAGSAPAGTGGRR